MGGDAAQAGDGVQDGGLHLDTEDAAGRPAAGPVGVGIVEDVARHDPADVEGLALCLGQSGGQAHEAPIGDGA